VGAIEVGEPLVLSDVGEFVVVLVTLLMSVAVTPGSCSASVNASTNVFL
jgi:hypothetical protein